MNIVLSEVTKIYNDIQAAIRILIGDKVYRRANRIKIKYLCAKKELKMGDIELDYVKTEDNLADGMKKSLTGKMFINMCERLM